MNIVFLGTASATPTLKRNLCSIALQREGEVLMFDCGEGTQMQLQRTAVRPSRISTIFVSHLHGDHVTGIVGLLMTLKLGGHSEPLTVVGPRGVGDYVAGSLRLLRLRMDFDLRLQEVRGGETIERDGYVVRSFPLDHGVPTIGYVLEEPTIGYVLEEPTRPGRFAVEAAEALGVPVGPLFGRLQRGEAVTTPAGAVVYPEQVLGPTRRGRKIVYALDTAPCAAVVEAARGADVLIHDSTFAGDEGELARERKHSTSVQAAHIARDAGVDLLLLTHISARHTGTSLLMRGVKRIHPNTRVAHDLLEVDVPLPE